MGADSRGEDEAVSPESANVYKAIQELQTVLVGMIDGARKESHGEHLTLLSRVDGIEERLRAVERKADKTPWPPLRASELTSGGDDRPIFRVSYADIKRWGWAATLFVALVSGANLAVEGFLRLLAWLGFHR